MGPLGPRDFCHKTWAKLDGIHSRKHPVIPPEVWGIGIDTKTSHIQKGVTFYQSITLGIHGWNRNSDVGKIGMELVDMCAG